MEKLFDVSVIKTLKDAIKRGKFTLKDLDTPPPGWTDCINNCKGNPAFPQGYQGVEYKILHDKGNGASQYNGHRRTD